jgi:hypothetical protein
MKKLLFTLTLLFTAAGASIAQTPSIDPMPPCLPCKGTKIVQAPKIDPMPPCLPCKGTK